jgi:hypothetical protein
MPRLGTGGRKHKGPREPILTRVPAPLADAVRARADESGQTVNDYVATVLAKEHHMLQYAPPPPGGSTTSAA